MQGGDRQQGLVRSCQVLFPWSFHFFGGGGDRDQARARLPYQWRSPACCSQLAQAVFFWWRGHSISWEFSHPSPGVCLGKGATYPGIGTGVGEQPERALLVAQWAHDGVIGFADLLAGEEGVERSKGE